MYKSYSELGAQPEQNRDLYSILEIQHGQHKGQLLTQNRVVVVDVYADWCGPCKQTAPDYAMLAKKYNKDGECLLVKENLDKKLTKVEGIPTFQYFVNGRQVDQTVGADLPEVESKIQAILGRVNSQPQQNSSYQGPNSNRHIIRQRASPYHGQNNVNSNDGPPPPPQGAVYNQPFNQGSEPNQGYSQYGSQGGPYGSQPPQHQYQNQNYN